MSKSIYHQAAVTIHDYSAVSPLSVEEIERIIADNTVTETAWRGAFEYIAKELGVEHIQMNHCSAATFAVLKRIQELNRQLAERKGGRRKGEVSKLDDKGRCCGVKPIDYKGGSWRSPKFPQKFCCRCSRAFDRVTGEQIENWEWTKVNGEWVHKTI